MARGTYLGENGGYDVFWTAMEGMGEGLPKPHGDVREDMEAYWPELTQPTPEGLPEHDEWESLWGWMQHMNDTDGTTREQIAQMLRDVSL